MKIAITGSTGLAETIAGVLRAKNNTVATPRIDDITMNDTDWYGFDKSNPNHVDVLINFAHRDFDQTTILDIAYRAWKRDENKLIINISSRAYQPNISKGHMYAAQKASINHLSNNLTYNSDKLCRISTLNLGLLNHELPSLSWDEVATAVEYLIQLPKHLEIPEMTLQSSANYVDIQEDKQTLKEFYHLHVNKL